jgi:IMP dehydrogenase
MNENLSFDDILIAPGYSDILSRQEIDIGNNLGQYKFRLPVISSPMDTVTESPMAATIASHGGLGIVHRYNSIEVQCRHIESMDASDYVGAAVGVTGDFLERAQTLVLSGAQVICVDIAHGHHAMMREALRKLRHKLGDKIHIMAGNVATIEGFNDLADWGADSIRIGIGGGSICSTRVQTGHGIPTLQSILNCSRSDRDAKIIADGGIKNSGDIVKAIAAGADFVMVGSILSGTTESPGEVITSHISGQRITRKAYRGMASADAQMDWRGRTSSIEGVSTTVPFKGPAGPILEQLDNGIRSGFSYSGARSLVEFQAKAKIVKQTSASQVEATTHIVRIN